MSLEIVFRDPSPETLVFPWDEPLVVNSHGSNVFGGLLRPAFFDTESKCPVVLMLHGHPGGDKNLDLAQYFRANGFAVAYFSYRGVWGSQGDYCLSHNIEDTIIVAEYIREHAAAFRIDSERLYLLGHSMGGFSALNAIAAGLKVKGAILMAPCDTGYKLLYDRPGFYDLMHHKHNGYFRLPSEDFMETDAELHANEWYFPNLVDRFDRRTMFRFIGGAKDVTTPPEHHILPVFASLQEKGFSVKYTLLADGHMFPVSRVRLATVILEYLEEMENQKGCSR